MNENKQFLTIRETAKETGLSTYFLRQAVRDESIPFIKCGNRVKINIPMLMDALKAKSVNGNCR